MHRFWLSRFCCLWIHIAHHRTHFGKTRRHSQNRKYITYVVTPPEEDQATATDNMHKKLTKFGRVVLELCERTHEKQTYSSLARYCVYWSLINTSQPSPAGTVLMSVGGEGTAPDQRFGPHCHNEFWVKCNWTSGMKIFSDNMPVLSQIHIWSTKYFPVTTLPLRSPMPPLPPRWGGRTAPQTKNILIGKISSMKISQIFSMKLSINISRRTGKNK